MKLILILLIFLSMTLSLSAQVFVKKDATGNNDGTSWNDAYKDLDFAINTTEIGEIWVAAGTYYPSTDLSGAIPDSDIHKTFRLKENIAIYGGFKGDEESLDQRDWENNQTILSGDLGEQDVLTDNIRHVVSAEYADLDMNTILDGLTIRDGYTGNQYGGAGIFVNQTSGGSFILRNCIIENNYSFRDGGGIYVFNSDPIIENNIIRNNKAFRGGGVYLYYSDAVLVGNLISNNQVDAYEFTSSSAMDGGGIYISSYSSPTIKNNIIKQNFAKHEGGAINIDSNYHTILEGNQIIENSARDGGGIFLDYSPTFFFNNVIAYNQATEDGGGIYMDYTPGPRFINNTVVNNSAGQGGGGLYMSDSNIEIVNSIIYSNTAFYGEQVSILTGRADWFPKFKFCNIQDGLNGISGNEVVVYENNISSEPEFATSHQYAFFLPEYSNMINLGTQDATLINGPWQGSNGQIIEFPTTDLTGNPRIFDNKIDIGAYEVQTSKSPPLRTFSIEAIGESCFNMNNGQIIVTTADTYDYVANLGDTSYDFNSNLNIDNLDVGSYTLCIKLAAEPDFEQCFNLRIEAAQEISGKSKTSKVNSKFIENIEMESGSAPYTISVNGNQVLKTMSSSFSVDVKIGDFISVSSKFPCEGQFKKQIKSENSYLFYPNPTKDWITIFVPVENGNEVSVKIYNSNNQLLKAELFLVQNNSVFVSLLDRPSGIYFLKIETENPILFKVIKQ